MYTEASTKEGAVRWLGKTMLYKGKQQHAEYQKARQKRLRKAWLAKEGPCICCTSWDNLEVDHIKSKQKVDHHVWLWSTSRREEELKKCQVLCNTCHKRKSRWQRMAYGRHGTDSMYRRY
jgi:hypothetical protein